MRISAQTENIINRYAENGLQADLLRSYCSWAGCALKARDDLSTLICYEGRGEADLEKCIDDLILGLYGDEVADDISIRIEAEQMRENLRKYAYICEYGIVLNID